MPDKHTKSNNILTISAVTTALSLSVFSILISFFSLVILNYNIANNVLHWFIYISTGISIAVSSVYAGNTISQKKLIYGLIMSLISSIILFVLLLICNATENINQIIFVIPIGVLSGLIGTITGINIPRRK